MSVKTETIEVRRCDFCISTSEARACQHCDKDACPNCGRIYNLSTVHRNPKPGLINLSGFGAQPAIFSAFVCNDCAKSELPTVMLGFGFNQQGSHKVNTA